VAYSFFVLVDGEADVRRRNRRVATLGPGDCFGELALSGALMHRLGRVVARAYENGALELEVALD
jgi:CRP-like cAMP-binding protein